MNVLIDIGNSSVKLGVLNPGERTKPHPALSSTSRFEHMSAPPIELPNSTCHWWVASVNDTAGQWLNGWVRDYRPQDDWTELTNDDIPVRTAVDNRQEVGIDRLCGVAGVNCRRDPERTAILVDFGTATTVNVVSVTGVFTGGAILPGVQTQLDQLSAATDRLPPVNWRDHLRPESPIGDSTLAALISGCYRGHIAAVTGLVAEIASYLERKPSVWIAGGGMPHHDDLTEDWHVFPHLVLEGIAVALESFQSGPSPDEF